MDTCANVKSSTAILTRNRLRIGFLIGGRPFENWQLRLFDRVLASPSLAIGAFLEQPPTSSRQSVSPLLRPLARLEQTVLAREPDYVPERFRPDAHRLERLPTPDDNCGERVAALVSQLDLDLVINMTSSGLPDEARRTMAYGEWSLSFSGDCDGAANWFGYDDVIRRIGSTELVLSARRGHEGEPSCISKSVFNAKFSVARSAGFIKERAVTLLMRELERVADTGELVPLQETSASPPHQPPSSSQLLRYTTALCGQLLARGGRAVRERMGLGSAVWTLFIGYGDVEDFDPRASVEIKPDEDEIRADPFLLEHEGNCYLFYEAYANGDTKAHIAVSRLAEGKLERLGVALERDYHLSYPYVFRHGPDLFMMPETHQARRLEVWRCIEFPLKWELYSTALHGCSAADSILIRHKDRWWLFTNLSDFHAYEDHCSELYVFEVDGPQLTHVVPHKRNPVIMGSATARNGGRIFELDGRLYRASQRNEHGIYGYGLNIMLIEQLDDEAYRERCVRTILPVFKPGLIGCHHFDAAGGTYVVDALLKK